MGVGKKFISILEIRHWDIISFSDTPETGEARPCVPITKDSISWLFWVRASVCLWRHEDAARRSRGSWTRSDACRRRSGTRKNWRCTGCRTHVQRVRHGLSKTLHPDHAHAETREVAQLQVHRTYTIVSNYFVRLISYMWKFWLCSPCSLCRTNRKSFFFSSPKKLWYKQRFWGAFTEFTKKSLDCFWFSLNQQRT